MTLNEPIVEDAPLSLFGELGYAIGHGPHLAPNEPAAERDSFGDFTLIGHPHEAIQIRLLQAERICAGVTA